MLPATHALLAHLQQPAAQQHDAVRQALVNAVLLGGSAADARALLAQFLRHPFDYAHAALLPVFERYGDAALAEAVCAVCCPAGELLADAPPEVLTLAARLGYTAVKPLLVRYAFGPADYYTAKHAALGLLHLDCQDLEASIRSAIEATLGKNVFPEFVPALVSKLPDRAAWLARLYASGTEYCSTDCNAGLLLGFSLCGPEGEAYFKQALFSPAWEAHSSGTGTRWFAYQGLRNLGLTLQGLYAELRPLSASPASLQYPLAVLLELLALKVNPAGYYTEAAEPFGELYPALFGQASDGSDDTLLELAALVGREDDARHLEALMALGLNQEVLRQNHPR
ncbi:hypothetical protein GCM10027048_42410 [Hymenobacter coalescens]